MVPLDINRTRTYEDSSLTAPADREREFWQFDHVRLYAPDIADRLNAAGFEVTTDGSRTTWATPKTERHRLLESDYLFVCRKPVPSESAGSS